MPKGMIDYLKRNPSAYSTLKNMDKYFEQKELRNDEGSTFWWFPPMRKRTASEKRRQREENDTLRTNEENLNDSDIDENIKYRQDTNFEEEYFEFPDPLEYLIGFFATKNDSSMKYQKAGYQNKIINTVSSPNKKPPIVYNNYAHEDESKQLYKSYYEWKRPSNPNNIVIDMGTPINSMSTRKYRDKASLSNSWEKGNIFQHNKHSLELTDRYSKSIDEDNRLWKTFDDNHIIETKQDSIERSSVNKPTFDPYISSRSYNYEFSGSKERMSYLTNNLSKMSTSKNSYSNDKRLQEKGYIIYGDGNLNKSIHNETSLLKDKESVEREPVYAGTISAGSGSVSSTKIKKELEGKRKKKFKKIEYLNKTKVVTSSINQATMKMGLQNSSYPGT